jgi:hypothetical protein
LRLLYIGGEYKRWYRKKMGIKTKKQIIEMKGENEIIDNGNQQEEKKIVG